MLSTQRQRPQKRESKSQTTQDVKQEPIKETIINNIIVADTMGGNNLLVEHIKETHTFTIKNQNTTIGSFTSGQVFKYINPDIDNFLLDVTLGTSIDIITKYLCKLEDNEIILVPHTESPITGNIDILVKLYKDLYDYEQNKLSLEIDLPEQIRFRNREFIYMILLQIIKLFSAYTTSNLQITQNVKDLIMKYTIGAVYKLSVMVKDDIDYNLSHIKNLTEDMSNLNKVRKNMQSQIDAISNAIQTENTKIDNIIINMMNPKQGILEGGQISTNSLTSISTTKSKTESEIKTSLDSKIETSLEAKLKIRSHNLTESKSDSESESDSITPIQNKFITPDSKLSDTSIGSFTPIQNKFTSPESKLSETTSISYNISKALSGSFYK